MKKHLLTLILLCTISLAYAQSGDSINVVRINKHYPLYDTPIVQTEDFKEFYTTKPHPHLIEALTELEKVDLLNEVNLRRRSLNRDTLTASDQLYVWKPYTQRLAYEDPHHQLFPAVNSRDEKLKNNKVKALGVSFININDTLIIDNTLDPQFKKGDRILKINDVPIETHLKYVTSKRHDIAMMLNYYYNASLTPEYKVEIIRNKKPLTIVTNGSGFGTVQFKLSDGNNNNIQTFDDAKCGYIAIPEFYPMNSRLIKILSKNIKKFKKNGCNNVILDLRKNPGGSGSDFDELMSIFINKPTINYLKSMKIKASKFTVGFYDFITEDMIGQVIDMPKDEFVSEFATNPKMYIDGMTYYVLISQSTGSVAASFVNILQYNDAATLVGEPLLHNALKYGEVVGPTLLYSNSRLAGVFCTTVMDEYTKAIDGVVMPDIAIPYVAKEYMTGKDAMLEKLLEIIKKTN